MKDHSEKAFLCILRSDHTAVTYFSEMSFVSRVWLPLSGLEKGRGQEEDAGKTINFNTRNNSFPSLSNFLLSKNDTGEQETHAALATVVNLLLSQEPLRYL